MIGVTKYLREGGKEERMIKIAGFRLGSELKGGGYWKEEEKRKYRICGWEEETWEHLILAIHCFLAM